MLQRWFCTGRESGFSIQVANQVACGCFCYLCGIKVLVQGTKNCIAMLRKIMAMEITRGYKDS